MSQVQVFSGVERRRRWSDEQKRAIVAAAFAPGAVVTDVARRADISSGQIYRWRRELQAVSEQGFAAVVVTDAPEGRRDAVIEVAFADRAHVRIPASIPPDLAAAVVRALVRR